MPHLLQHVSHVDREKNGFATASGLFWIRKCSYAHLLKQNASEKKMIPKHSLDFTYSFVEFFFLLQNLTLMEEVKGEGR